jgi:hypothetical protein
VRVVGTGEQRRELDLLELSLEPVDRLRELLRQFGVVRVLQQLVDRLGVTELALQRVEPLDLSVQPSELRGDLLRPCLVVPEPGIGRLLLELRGPRALAVDVKGTPWRRGPAPRGP